MINIEVVDLIRWLTVGQTMSSIIAIVTTLILFLRRKPRPGRLIGAIAILISYCIFFLTASIGAFEKLGEPPTYLLWLRLTAVSVGNFGLLMSVFNLAFHDKRVLNRFIRCWNQADCDKKDNIINEVIARDR